MARVALRNGIQFQTPYEQCKMSGGLRVERGFARNCARPMLDERGGLWRLGSRLAPYDSSGSIRRPHAPTDFASSSIGFGHAGFAKPMPMSIIGSEISRRAPNCEIGLGIVPIAGRFSRVAMRANSEVNRTDCANCAASLESNQSHYCSRHMTSSTTMPLRSDNSLFGEFPHIESLLDCGASRLQRPSHAMPTGRIHRSH